MLRRLCLVALVAVAAAAPARAHGGEALFCLPFVWVLEAYTFCLEGCFALADGCCCCGAPDHVRADDDDVDEDVDKDEGGDGADADDGVDVVYRPAVMRY